MTEKMPRHMSPRIPRIVLRRVMHMLEAAGAAMPPDAKRALASALQGEFWRGYRAAMVDVQGAADEYENHIEAAGRELDRRMGELRKQLPKQGWPMPKKEPKA